MSNNSTIGIINDLTIERANFKSCYNTITGGTYDFTTEGAVNVHDVQYIDCEFTGLVDKATDFTHCKFINCKFHDIVIQDGELSFNGCIVFSSKFENIKYVPKQFEQKRSVILDSCVLYRSQITKLNCSTCLLYTEFYDSYISNSIIYGSRIDENCCFNDTNISRSCIMNSYIKGATISSHLNFCSDKLYLYNCIFNNGSSISVVSCNVIKYNSNIEDTIRYGCPAKGSFIGYKQAYASNTVREREVIVVLEIPEDAKRVSSLEENKCRCDKAKVLRFEEPSTGEELTDVDKCASIHYGHCEYVVGEIVYADDFDDDPTHTCSHGIHFFVNRWDAVNY